MTIYGTQDEEAALRSGEWTRELVESFDRTLSSAGCCYCEGAELILQRLRIDAVESVFEDPAGAERIIISCACLTCRSSWPIEYKVGDPPAGEN
jgi:hypothetical protein